MITITSVPLSRDGTSAAKGGGSLPDHASTLWNGVAYATPHGNGAVLKLARILVEAGCPDQPWETRNAEGHRSLYGHSLHQLSRLTVTDKTGSARFAKWSPRPDLAADDAA